MNIPYLINLEEILKETNHNVSENKELNEKELYKIIVEQVMGTNNQNKTYEDLGIVDFEKAKQLYLDGHRYLSWYGYTKDGEIVDYKDDSFLYPAPSSSYPNL